MKTFWIIYAIGVIATIATTIYDIMRVRKPLMLSELIMIVFAISPSSWLGFIAFICGNYLVDSDNDKIIWYINKKNDAIRDTFGNENV